MGNLPDSRRPTVAIVGTRKPSAYGKEVTHRLAYELASRGVVVVSGLALGVDGIAHRAALEAGGTTIAVLANGLPNIAAIPAQAPALNMIFLSAAEMCMICPVKDPNAPPVAIIGPSAPKGPPVPIEIAADKGFKIVIKGGILLFSKIIFSIASGMPCPRIAFEPNLAISPTSKLPIMGMKITAIPRLLLAGLAGWIENLP